jgi:hypothetical protein
MAYVGFNKLKGQLAQRPGVTIPGGLAAYIGERKFGAKAMRQAASKGASLRGHRPKKTARHQAIQRFVKHHHG